MPESYISREELGRLAPVWVHTGRRSTQPDVSGFEADGRRFVVKDFARRARWLRRTWGRWILRREWSRMERLQGIEGIPRLLGWVDNDAFVMEWVQGDRLPQQKANAVEPVVFERLQAIMNAMHARGVSHGDLRRKNILFDRENRPYLIDFATAQVKGKYGRRWFERLCEFDRATLLKLKHYYCPESITDVERKRLDAVPLPLRIGRFLRKKIYRPFKPRQIRRRWARLKEKLGI